MAVTAAQGKDIAFVGPLGGLLLSVVRPRGPMFLVRAIKWFRDLDRLGICLPFFLVHDLGLLYAAPADDVDIGARPTAEAVLARLGRGGGGGGAGAKGAESAAPASALHASYQSLVLEIAESEASAKARALRLGDDLITVILARMLGSLAASGSPQARPPYRATLPLDPALARGLDEQLPALFQAAPRAFELAMLGDVARAKLHLLTLADALDIDTLRLLGMLGPAASAQGALAHVDLLAALASPSANDIVRFSLELLPSILETKRTRSSGTSSTDGYAGLGQRGSLDSMVLTELAWDPEEFARRFLDQEILYYAREQAPEEARRLHYFLIDASASMRGDRQVFARGLAIALGKKLQLAGEEVWMRFFDSRLYDVQRPRPGQLPASYLLGFKGERGRNPARVFAQLATEVALVRSREQKDPVIHLITHAALHVPRALVAEVRKTAHLYGIFILPSGGRLDLDYLDLLEGHAVIDHATLQKKAERAAAATKIVDDAAAASLRPASVARSAAGPSSRRGAPVSEPPSG
jgi:hypothetical protein